MGSCETARTCPYRAATEIWYHNDIGPQDSNYTVCGVIGEDNRCDSVINLSVEDHEFYFGMHIGAYCHSTNAIAEAAAARTQAEHVQAQLEARGVVDKLQTLETGRDFFDDLSTDE